MAATIVTLSSLFVPAPSNCTRNSVFSRFIASPSLLDLEDNNESTSSIKMMHGCISRAMLNSARTIFSPSPTHFEVRDDADILKNFASGISAANAFAKSVFPFPGGPYRSKPFGGALIPENARFR